jgi:bifunctional DNase/RNase
MLEMIVRTVDHDPKSGSPVAILLPRDLRACAPLALPIESVEACSLTHELEDQITPRAGAYALLAQTLSAVGGYVAAITLAASADGAPVARVRVCRPNGWTEHLTGVTSALGLSVYSSLPLLVSEHLVRASASLESPSTDGPLPDDNERSSTVPASFHHALHDEPGP